MNKNIFLIAVLSTFLLSSCESESSADVSQDRIYTAFSLSYDAEVDITVARARFRFGNATGTLLELAPPSEISVNGEPLSFNSTLAQYSKNFPGFESSVKFVWNDTDEQQYSNTLSLKTIDFPEITTISRDASYELIWEGDALSEGEYVTLYLDDVSGETNTLFTENSTGSSSIILARDELQELLPGQATMKMVRGFSKEPSQSPDAGGSLKGEYHCLPIEITLE